MPNTASRYRGISRNIAPTTAATPSPMRDATRTPATARSGLPAPRFWPAIVAEAPISPTDVHVMSENSSV